MDYLKTKSVNIESIGKALTIRQLSAKGAAEFSRIYEDVKTRHLAGAVICKYGVPDWSALEAEEISASLTVPQIDEISKAIHELSQADVKNSASTPQENSSSN